jgi:hypothetical protein
MKGLMIIPGWVVVALAFTGAVSGSLAAATQRALLEKRSHAVKVRQVMRVIKFE